MADESGHYTMWRYRRGRRRVRLIRPFGWRRPALIVGTAIAVALCAWWLLRPVPVAPREALRQARAAFAVGDVSGSARLARLAGADPALSAAAVHLARASLILGDVDAAGAAVDRAAATGYPAGALHGLRAQVLLAQGDIEGAAEEAARASGAGGVRVRARVLTAQGEARRGDALLSRWLARAGSDAQGWAALARMRLDAGDIGGAGEAAARAVSLDPHDPAALTLNGVVVRARYGLKAALPWFDAALARDAHFPDALRERAATSGDLGQYRRMLADTRRLLADRPGDPQALYLQAVLAARAGEWALSRELVTHGGDALVNVPGGLLLLGTLDFQAGHPEQAVVRWRALLDRQPTNLSVRRLLAGALLRSGSADEAGSVLDPLVRRPDADGYSLELAARAESLMRNEAAALELRGRVGSGRGGAMPFAADDALPTLAAAAGTDPGDPHAAVGLVRGQLAAGDGAGATETARGLVRDAPGASGAWLALGDAWATMGRYPAAADAYRRAANLRFDRPTALRLLDALGRIGRGSDAAAVLATYVGQNPRDPEALALLGHWQLAGGEPKAAAATLERVRQMLGYRDATVLGDLAVATARSGDRARGLLYARAAYRLAPSDRGVVASYALVARGAAAAQLRAKEAALASPR